MTRFLKLLPIVAAALVFYFLMPMHAMEDTHAQGVPGIPGTGNIFGWNSNPTGTPAANNIETLGPDGTRSRCREYKEAKGGVLLGTIIPCLVHTIERSTESFSEKMIDMLRPLFYSFLTLVIVFFGVKVLQGEREIKTQAFVFVFKLAMVVAVLESIPHGLVPATYGIMSDGVAVVSSTLGPDSSSIACDIEKYGDEFTPLIWKQMDCVLGKLYGFATGKGTAPDGTKQVNMLLASSAVGMLTGFFFGGTLGVAVFFAMIGVLISIALLVLRTALAFMNGYLIVCVLLIIAPIFLPLVLMKVTSDYFEKWWKAILGGLLLPVIVACYSMFALLMYDKLLFEKDSKLQHIFSYPKVQSAMQNTTKLCDMNVTNDSGFKGKDGKADSSELDELFKSPFLQNLTQPLLSGGSDACSLFEVPKIDVTKIKAAGFENERQAMLDLFKDCVKLFIMAFLIAEGVATVQTVISSLTGGSSLSRAAMTARSEVETNIAHGFEAGKASFSRSFSGVDDLGNATSARDVDFLQRLPGAGRKAAGEFLGGIKRK